MCRFSSKVARLLMTSCSFFFSFLDVRSESDVFFLTNEPFSMTSVGINWEKESPSQESSQRAGREQKPWAILIQEWPLLASGYRRGQHWSKTKIHLTSTLKYFFSWGQPFRKEVDICDWLNYESQKRCFLFKTMILKHRCLFLHVTGNQEDDQINNFFHKSEWAWSRKMQRKHA